MIFLCIHRYGWYIPTQFVQSQWTQNKLIVDHWRSLLQQNTLSQLELNKTALLQIQNITEIRQYCGGKKSCLSGISSVIGCDRPSCILMLADAPG